MRVLSSVALRDAELVLDGDCPVTVSCCVAVAVIDFVSVFERVWSMVVDFVWE